MASPRQQEHQIDPSEVGIGRPLTERSLENFMLGFEEVMPSEVILQPFDVPRLTYVHADDLASVHSYELPQLTYPKVAAWVGKLLNSLCDITLLDGATALLPATFTIDQIRGRGPASNMLQARLWDRPDNYYPDGYTINGERSAIKHALGLPRVDTGRNPNKQPRTILQIGHIVSGSDSPDIKKYMAAVRRRIGGQVTLGAVGPISCSPQPYYGFEHIDPNRTS